MTCMLDDFQKYINTYRENSNQLNEKIMKVLNTLDYFSRDARAKRELQSDVKRLSMLGRLADKSVNVRYVNSGIWITVEGIPMLRVTSESDLSHRTISIDQVDAFVRDIREDWISSHKHDRMDMRGSVVSF